MANIAKLTTIMLRSPVRNAQISQHTDPRLKAQMLAGSQEFTVAKAPKIVSAVAAHFITLFVEFMLTL
jgi:hypothetical protein